MFTPLITHDSDGTALAAPVDAARRNGATYKTRTIDDLRIKDDRLRAAIEGTGHLLFDGGMGTMLQAAGMKAGALPELLNFEEPQVITDIQRQYVEAGCDVITANTFGANAHKLDGAATVANVFAAAVACAHEAGARYVAGDIGPIGALLRPLGTLSFDEAYDLFAEEVRAGVDAGVDLFIIETMTDLAEIKAAVLACRENSDLPVFATMTFEEDGRTFLGTSPEVAAITLDAIGADVLGINCSQGPAELRGLAARMLTVTDKPVMVQANAGLPRVDDDGNTVFDIQAAEYAEAVAGMIADGVSVVGGCCGTTPAHMAALRTLIDNHTPSPRHRKPSMSVTSAQTVVDLPCDGHKIAVIGERINPTGKKRLQQALRDGDLDYVVSQGISQQEQGADILDVNVGLPEIDEVKVIQQATEQLQGSTLLPLQIDSTDPAAVEAAVRRYAGKPIINSVNGKQQIMDEIFPLVAHYGTNVVGLTLDEGGIPDTAEARFAIAERIVAEAARYGIGPDRILIDCLVMTASTNQTPGRADSARHVPVQGASGRQMRAWRVEYQLWPARSPAAGLGLFGPPPFGAGLDAPIMNPGSKRFMDTVYSYRVLSVEDEGSTGYIERYAGWTDPYKIAANPAAAQPASSDAAPAAGADGNDDPIRRMVVSGRKGEIAAETERLLADHDAMDLINNHFIPALDEVGVLFDQGKFFLPQLMASAEAARVGFDTIKRLMPAGEIADKGKICVATVKGDIHDIGKNIVKMLLDNYGYTVFDLGRDVDPQEVLKTVQERDIKLVGLSALMTTTVVAMEETIKLLHTEVPGVKIIVGGAVLTPEYAKQIGADYYAKDAAESARIAEEVFGQ